MAAYLNMEEGLGRVRGNRKLFKKMLGMFLNSAEFGQFEEALSAGDNAKAGDVAHAIKGMVGNLGMNALFESSAKLMEQLRGGDADLALVEEYRETLAETRRQAEEAMLALEEDA